MSTHSARKKFVHSTYVDGGGASGANGADRRKEEGVLECWSVGVLGCFKVVGVRFDLCCIDRRAAAGTWYVAVSNPCCGHGVSRPLVT